MARDRRHRLLLLLLRYLVVALGCKLRGYLRPPTRSCWDQLPPNLAPETRRWRRAAPGSPRRVGRGASYWPPATRGTAVRTGARAGGPRGLQRLAQSI